MNQLKKMFGASRIAANPRDKIVTTWPATAKHITVIYKDQFFSVPAFDADGQVLTDKAMTRLVILILREKTTLMDR